MKAMQTTFISPTDTLSPRIKVSADGESMTYAWQSGLTIQENHHCAAVSFALSRDWLLGGLEVVTGWLAEGTYVHTFGPARDGSDCAMCGAYAPTADGMIHEGAFICSDCVHDNEVRADRDLPGLDVGSHKEERDMAIVVLQLMLDKYGQDDHESAVARRVLLLLESRNKWIDGGDLKFALGGLLDCMGYDATPKGLLDRLGWSVEEFDDEVPGLHLVETEGGE